MCACLWLGLWCKSFGIDIWIEFLIPFFSGLQAGCDARAWELIFEFNSKLIPLSQFWLDCRLVMMQELGSSLTRLGQSMQLGRLSKCGDIWKWWWVHCRTRCPIHCKGLLLARGQLASSGRRLWAGQVPFPGENISRLGKGEHWAWQALQGITRIPLPNQPVLRLARSIQMRSTENGPLYLLAYSL